MKLREILVALVLAAAVLFGQSSAEDHTSCMQRIVELSREVAQVQIELASYRLESRQANVQNLEVRLARAVAERHAADQEAQSNREDALNVEIQLSRNDLRDDEKAELQNMRNTLLGEEQFTAQERRSVASQAEAALRDQLARENAATAELQKRLQILQSPARR